MSEQVISSPPKLGPMVQAERIVRTCSHCAEAQPPFGLICCVSLALRARGDDEASVERSAARGAIGIITRPNIAKRSKSSRTRERSGGGMTTAMAGQSWLTHSPKPPLT